MKNKKTQIKNKMMSEEIAAIKEKVEKKVNCMG